jgi:transcriptional regulator with XRE-family HTH domain
MAFDRNVFNEEVGLRLQLRRKRQGLTQAEVADALEMPRSTYANMERGEQRVPVDVVWRVAVLLGVSTDALLPQPKSQRSMGVATSVDVADYASSAPQAKLDTGLPFSSEVLGESLTE